MAAGKFKAYDKAKLYWGDGTFNFADGTNWKMALFTAASNADTLGVGTGVYGDLTNEVANGNGYLTGGVAVTGFTYNETAGVATIDIADPSWIASGGNITAAYAVLYKNATVNSVVKPLLCVCLLDATTPGSITIPDGFTFTLTINSTGVVTLSGATTN